MVLYGEVIEVERLTPHMVRVVLGGDGLADFSPTPFTDQYVNALFLPPGAPYDVPFDPEVVKDAALQHRPRGRRFSIRAWDPASGRLTIDFVVHGDVGFAGRWATHAEPGDRLQIVGPSGGYAPDPDADWYLMVGDESALPAIAASLARVPAGRRVDVLVQVEDAADEIELSSPGNLRVQWIHEPGDAVLADAVRALEWPDGEVDVFVHGEASSVRELRRLLLGERGLAREAVSISGYWKRTRTEEGWREDKPEWNRLAEADLTAA